MKKLPLLFMRRIRILPFLFLIITTIANAETLVYITDQVDIPIRSEKSLGNNIIRLLPSDTKLSLLQITEDGWTKIKYKSTIGWISSRYLSNNIPAREEVKKLKAEVEILKKQVAFLEIRKKALTKQKSKDAEEKTEVQAIEAKKIKELAESKLNEISSKAKVPENATKYSGAEAWYCNTGYIKSGVGCKKVKTDTEDKWWEKTDKYYICYGNITKAHKETGLHDRNRRLSVQIKEEICKIAATSTTGEGSAWLK
jgi:SH3 domain protein